jgi:hypothetical protein
MQVSLVRHRPTGHTYALKAVNKAYVQKTRTAPLLKREVTTAVATARTLLEPRWVFKDPLLKHRG